MNGFFYSRTVRTGYYPQRSWDHPEIKKNPNQASIQHLILIDREVDYITPLLTQQVYTGNFMNQEV